jgi:peptide/nickel transport system substrate-binding protein
MKLRRWMAAALVSLAALLPSVGCSAISGGGGDALVIAVESAPRSLDPRLGSGDSVSARLHQIVFDSLVRKNERFEFVPHLAESFERSPDAKTWTFRLRPGVKTHNGRDLTSADVKFTYESIKAPELKSPVAGSFNRITSVDTPDPLTVVMHCSEPYYQLLGDLVAVPVMVEVPNAGKGLPVGTGPFKVVDATEQTVDLEANPDYFLGAPSVAKLRVRVVPDNATRELELKSGGVDLAINSSFGSDQIAKMKSDPDLDVLTGPGTNIAHLGLNTTDETLRDARVRRALAYALDRNQIIATVMQGQGRAADAILPPESWAYEAGVSKYPFDVARAKQLLDEAGYKDPDGDGPGVRFTLEFVTSNVGIAPAIGQIVQEEWKAAGVGVNLSQFERATFTDRLNQGSYDAYFIISVGGNQTTDVFSWAYYGGAWGQDRVDLDAARAANDWAKAQAVLDRKQVCVSPALEKAVAARDLAGVYDLLTARGAGNRMRYCNPAVDDEVLAAERSTDREEQRALFGRIQKTASEDVPQIYLWYSDNVVVARKRVGNVQIDPSGAWYFLQKVTVAA